MLPHAFWLFATVICARKPIQELRSVSKERSVSLHEHGGVRPSPGAAMSDGQAASIDSKRSPFRTHLRPGTGALRNGAFVAPSRCNSAPLRLGVEV